MMIPCLSDRSTKGLNIVFSILGAWQALWQHSSSQKFLGMLLSEMLLMSFLWHVSTACWGLHHQPQMGFCEESAPILAIPKKRTAQQSHLGLTASESLCQPLQLCGDRRSTAELFNQAQPTSLHWRPPAPSSAGRQSSKGTWADMGEACILARVAAPLSGD